MQCPNQPEPLFHLTWHRHRPGSDCIVDGPLDHCLTAAQPSIIWFWLQFMSSIANMISSAVRPAMLPSTPSSLLNIWFKFEFSAPFAYSSYCQLWWQAISLEVLVKSNWAVSWAENCIESDICLSALLYNLSVKRMNATAFSLIGYSGYLYSEIWQFLMLPSRGLYSLLNLTSFINIINIMRLLNNIIWLSLS